MKFALYSVRGGERVKEEASWGTADGFEGRPRRGERVDRISEGRNGKERF